MPAPQGRPQPLNAAHDYELHLNKDERYYEKLENKFLVQHRCTFPISMLSSNQNMVQNFDPCDKSITFRIPPTKGTGWRHGAINQRYKDQKKPLIETVSFPLWSKLWTQYKIDKYHFRCKDAREYQGILDDVNMKDLNDTLLSLAIQLLYTYENVFCNSCDQDFGSETDPLFIEEGSSALTDYMFERANAFQVNCFPSSGWMVLLPMCVKSIFVKDKAFADQYLNCCAQMPPALSGSVSDMYQTVNGLTPVFLQDSFFETMEIDGHTAYKIPVFHADALAYHPAFMDSVTIGEDKEEDGMHFRRNFFYFMNVLHDNMVSNDWVIFKKAGLSRLSTRA